MKGSARLTALVLAAILILSGCGGDATPASGASSSSSVSEAAEPSSSLAEQSEKSSASSAPDDVKENPETPSSPEASTAESSVSQTGTIPAEARSELLEEMKAVLADYAENGGVYSGDHFFEPRFSPFPQDLTPPEPKEEDLSGPLELLPQEQLLALAYDCSSYEVRFIFSPAWGTAWDVWAVEVKDLATGEILRRQPPYTQEQSDAFEAYVKENLSSDLYAGYQVQNGAHILYLPPLSDEQQKQVQQVLDSWSGPSIPVTQVERPCSLTQLEQMKEEILALEPVKEDYAREQRQYISSIFLYEGMVQITLMQDFPELTQALADFPAGSVQVQVSASNPDT